MERVQSSIKKKLGYEEFDLRGVFRLRTWDLTAAVAAAGEQDVYKVMADVCQRHEMYWFCSYISSSGPGLDKLTCNFSIHDLLCQQDLRLHRLKYSLADWTSTLLEPGGTSPDAVILRRV